MATRKFWAIEIQSLPRALTPPVFAETAQEALDEALGDAGFARVGANGWTTIYGANGAEVAARVVECKTA